MLDNLLKKNPVLGVIIYPLLGLGAIWLGHYYSQSLSLLDQTRHGFLYSFSAFLFLSGLYLLKKTWQYSEIRTMVIHRLQLLACSFFLF